MTDRGLNQNLLEGGDFTSLSQEVQVNLQDIQFNKQNINEIASKINNDSQINNRILIQYKSSMKKMDTLIPHTEHLLESLSNVCYSQREQNIHRKLQDAFEEERDKYLEQKQELEYLVKDKNLERRIESIPDRSLQGSMLSSIDATDQMQEQPEVVQVYDQERFINERSERVNHIKNDAQELNRLAVEIHTRVEQQDNRLDDLNRDLDQNRIQVVKAQQDLFEAAEKGQKSRKTQCLLVLALAIVIAIIAIYLLFRAGIIGGGGSNNRLLRL